MLVYLYTVTEYLSTVSIYNSNKSIKKMSQLLNLAWSHTSMAYHSKEKEQCEYLCVKRYYETDKN